MAHISEKDRRALVPVLGCLVTAALIVGACSETSDISGPELSLDRVQTQDGSGGRGEFPSVPRVAVQLEASGPFRPGLPIAVTARASAQHNAEAVEFDLEVLDVPPEQRLTPGRRQLKLGQWQGNLTSRAERQLTNVVTFSQPGYYRVLARTHARPGAGAATQTADGIAIRALDAAFLWIVVDEEGGRLTNGFDSEVIDAQHLPLYGAYGPFRERPVRLGRNSAGIGVGDQGVASSTRLPASSPGLNVFFASAGGSDDWAPRASGRSIGLTTNATSYVLQGEVEYLDLGPNPDEWKPLTEGTVEGNCYGKSEPWLAWYDLEDPYTVGIGYFGTFTVQCPTGYDYVDGRVNLEDVHSHTLGPGGNFPGVYFEEYTGQTVELVVGNDHAAHFFLNLEKYAPIGANKFDHSRSKVHAWVWDHSDTVGSHYDQIADRIVAAFGDVFNERGDFVAAHEYGHAFHYVALEQWNYYFCSDSGTHYMGTEYTPSCAFVEGFGDFFAGWVADADLIAGAGSDYDLERNLYKDNGDGLLIEGAVAGFLYDLVDDANDPNGSNNQSTSSDDDSLSVDGSYVADVIQTCQLNSVTKLDGMDQFIYCAEESLSAQNVAPTYSDEWRTSYTSVSVSVSTPGLQAIRALWLKNLYDE